MNRVREKMACERFSRRHIYAYDAQEFNGSPIRAPYTPPYITASPEVKSKPLDSRYVDLTRENTIVVGGRYSPCAAARLGLYNNRANSVFRLCRDEFVSFSTDGVWDQMTPDKIGTL